LRSHCDDQHIPAHTVAQRCHRWFNLQSTPYLQLPSFPAVTAVASALQCRLELLPCLALTVPAAAARRCRPSWTLLVTWVTGYSPAQVQLRLHTTAERQLTPATSLAAAGVFAHTPDGKSCVRCTNRPKLQPQGCHPCCTAGLLQESITRAALCLLQPC
jgi:hypothetical protein